MRVKDIRVRITDDSHALYGRVGYARQIQAARAEDGEPAAPDLLVRIGGELVTVRPSQVSRAGSLDAELADSLLRLVTALACGCGRIDERMKNALRLSGLRDYPETEISQDLREQWRTVTDRLRFDVSDLSEEAASTLAHDLMTLLFPAGKPRPL